MIEIINIIDGPALSQDCALGLAECGGDDVCPFHPHWGHIRESLIEALSSQSLRQFARQ